MVVIGVYNNFIVIYGWCKSVESFNVIFLWGVVLILEK